MGDENYSIMKNIKSMLSYDFYWYSFVDNFDTVVIWWNLFAMSWRMNMNQFLLQRIERPGMFDMLRLV